MKLEMYYVDNDRSETLSEFIQTKVDKLETFYDGILNGEVYVRSEKGDPKKEKVIDATIMSEVMGSDHCPVSINLKTEV